LEETGEDKDDEDGDDGDEGTGCGCFGWLRGVMRKIGI